MSTQPSLFAESPEAAIAKLDNEILLMLIGQSGGPLGLVLSEDEKNVLRAIRYRRGLANTIAIAELQQITKLSARQIKEVVRNLRINFRVPVGSSKRANAGGYYLIITPEDRAAWVKDVLDQVRAELAVLRAAAGPQATLELLGQLHMEANS